MALEANDLVWLLLPIAAASGWFLAHLDQRRKDKSRDFTLPSAYFKGLNYLLNEEPDKAIEIFIRVLEVNTETAETHLALGNLFRRRGEVERAIRIHQNLIARPSLDKGQRALALLELGQDYLKAGLFDRAENLFTELVDHPDFKVQALKLLLNIYQQEREWKQAIAAGQKLEKESGENMGKQVSQYYCQLADEAIKSQDLETAKQYVKQALSSDSKCVRASLLRGDIEEEQGNHREAIKAWRRIEKQDPLYLGEAAERIAKSFRNLGDEKGLREFFSTISERYNSSEMMLVLGDLIRERDGVEVAESFVVDWLRRKPSVQGLYRLIDLNVWKGGNKNNDLVLLKGIIGELKNRQEGYVCEQCGFRGRTLHWLCPGCQSWDTVKPMVEE